MKLFLKKHTLAILLAVSIGIITGLPQLVAISSTPGWSGIFPTVNDDEIYYQARGQEIADGHYFLTNPYLYEYKDASPMQFWLPDFIVAKPLALFDVPVQVGYIAYDFILPVILALLSYAIIFTLTRSRQASLVGMIAIHLGLFLSLFNRGPSPQFIFIIWQLVALLFLRYELYKKTSSAVLLSLVFGLLFYMYPYYWTYYVIFFILYLAIRFAFGNRRLKSYLYIFLGSAVISIPYFWAYIQSTSLPYYTESVIRLGLLETHFPSGYMIVIPGVLLIALLLLMFWKKPVPRLDPKALFVFSGVVACVIAVNHHIVTGKNLEFSSHYYPLSMVTFVYAAAYVYTHWSLSLPERIRIRIAALVVLLVVPWSIVEARDVVLRQIVASDIEIQRQQYVRALKWIDFNTNADDVFFANQRMSALIPAYTHANVFYAREANLFFLPSNEVAERFILNNYWAEYSEEFLRKNERALWGTQYINAYGHIESRNKILRLLGQTEYTNVRFPQDVMDNMIQRAKDIQATPLLDQLSIYKVDYVVVDNDRDDWNMDDFGNVSEVFYDKEVTIYKLHKEK
ncbi:MAG: hypothetical protein ACPGO5_01810 [Patescibacteria group bacterium]